MYADQPINQSVKPKIPQREAQFLSSGTFQTHSATNPQNAIRNSASEWLLVAEAAFERLGPLVDVGFPTLGVFDGDDGDDDVEVLLLKTWGTRLGLLEFVWSLL